MKKGLHVQSTLAWSIGLLSNSNPTQLGSLKDGYALLN